MDSLGGAYGGEVTVTLISKHQARGIEPLDSRRHSRRTSVGSLDPVNVDIVVGHDRTSHRGYGYGDILGTHLLDDLGHKFVHHTVGATRAIVHGIIVEQMWLACHNTAGLNDFFLCHNSNFSLSATSTSSGSMTMPPMRPKWWTGMMRSRLRRTSSIIWPALSSTTSMPLT